MRASSHPETLVGTAQFSMQKRAIFVQVLGRQGFPRLVPEYAAQGNPQSDDEIAKKRRFWTRMG
jgi:hypothetical protein